MRSGKFYRKNEADVMEDLGLVATKGSGAGWIEKEDGYNEFILCQLKSTDASSVRLQKLDWDKLEMHAITEKKTPVFAFQFLQSNEVFLVIKPEDIETVYEALFKGEGRKQKESILDIECGETHEKRCVSAPIKSSSKGRSKFYEEKEKERKENERKWQKQKK